MKPLFAKNFILICIILFTGRLFSQENVGIGTTTPDPSSLLDLSSANKGLLIPRVVLSSPGNSTSPVNNPAVGLLVYNSGGSMASGFWYWNGSQWSQIGTGGGGCSSLDQSYDCGGAGVGRTITSDAGSLEIIMPASASNNDAVSITSNKGTQAIPSAAIYALNTQHGTALFAETNLGTNLYGAIQGASVITNANTNYIPGAISGYKSGNGIGTGVYGEAQGTGSAAGAGMTGYGINNNFGGDFWSQNFPGLQVETSNPSNQALQVVAAATSPLNPAIYSLGWSQLQCSNSPQGHSLIANNLAGEATWASSQGQYGFLGTAAVGWWQMYYYNATALSRREYKRNIHNIKDDLANFIMSDIEEINPTFYKFHAESDEFIPGKEAKVRYNMHLGLIVDEVPDYIQDNTFSGIDVYALATLAIAGVQHNRESVKKLEHQIATIETRVFDAGTASITGGSYRVNFSQDFRGVVPFVTVTPTNGYAEIFISRQDEKGFTVNCLSSGTFSFNWIAFANCEAVEIVKENEAAIGYELLSQLRVDPLKKHQMQTWADSLQQKASLKPAGRKIERKPMSGLSHLNNKREIK
jgi:hypothetical protein